MAFNQTEKQEKEYLKQIISFLKKVIGNTDASVKDHVDTLAEYKDYIWSNKDIDPHEIRSMRESILNHFALGVSYINIPKHPIPQFITERNQPLLVSFPGHFQARS